MSDHSPGVRGPLCPLILFAFADIFAVYVSVTTGSWVQPSGTTVGGRQVQGLKETQPWWTFSLTCCPARPRYAAQPRTLFFYCFFFFRKLTLAQQWAYFRNRLLRCRTMLRFSSARRVSLFHPSHVGGEFPSSAMHILTWAGRRQSRGSLAHCPIKAHICGAQSRFSWPHDLQSLSCSCCQAECAEDPGSMGGGGQSAKCDLGDERCSRCDLNHLGF